MVAAEHDVRRHQAVHRRQRAAEHEVLARCLEIVVLDQERPGAAPAGDRLRVLAGRLDVGDVGADDDRRGAVQRDAALLAACRDRRGCSSDRRRDRGACPAPDCAAVASPSARMSLPAAAVRSDLEQHEPPVMGAGRGAQRRRAVGRLDPARACRCATGRSAPSASGRPLVAARPQDGVAIAGLRGQDEVAGERRAARQLDDVAGLGAVERRLEIAAGTDADRRRCLARRRRLGDLERGRQCLCRQPQEQRERTRFHRVP